MDIKIKLAIAFAAGMLVMMTLRSCGPSSEGGEHGRGSGGQHDHNGLEGGMKHKGGSHGHGGGKHGKKNKWKDNERDGSVTGGAGGTHTQTGGRKKNSGKPDSGTNRGRPEPPTGTGRMPTVRDVMELKCNDDPDEYVRALSEKVWMGQFERRKDATRQGQIVGNTPFGRELHQRASSPDVEVVLEIGTWKGAGSSDMLSSALAAHGGRLVTVEAVADIWTEAIVNLAGTPTYSFLGASVDPKWIPEVKDVSAEANAAFPGQNWKDWLKGEADTTRMWGAHKNSCALIPPLCRVFRPELVLLDGAEFLGRGDFEETIANCDSLKTIALHDVNVVKNKKVMQTLIANPDWSLAAQGKLFAIFEKVE